MKYLVSLAALALLAVPAWAGYNQVAVPVQAQAQVYQQQSFASVQSYSSVAAVNACPVQANVVSAQAYPSVAAVAASPYASASVARVRVHARATAYGGGGYVGGRYVRYGRRGR